MEKDNLTNLLDTNKCTGGDININILLAKTQDLR